MSKELIDAIVEMREADALSLASAALEQGEEPINVLHDARQAMECVGERFEAGEYFLPELMMAGEIMTHIADLAKPRMTGDFEAERIGQVVLGTVEGDIHDIGKDIVAFMLDVNGLEVHDLGVDVPPQAFVEKIRETGAHILGLSGFLHFAHQSMRDTIELLEREGLRDDINIMIGGGQIDEKVKAYTGADAWGSDAMDAVVYARKWVQRGSDHG